MYKVREAERGDLKEILELYTYLHEKEVPVIDEKIKGIWKSIMINNNYHVIVLEDDGIIVSSCVLLIVPNLTRGQRPYSLIENVVTNENYRKKGYAGACLRYAKRIAQKENCYKMMLLTGSKEESTLDFYKKSGYNCNDKTGFVQWL